MACEVLAHVLYGVATRANSEGNMNIKWVLTRVLLAVLGLGAWGLPAQAETTKVDLVCQVFYQPARSIWVRHVQMLLQGDRVQALYIDGLKPYSFNANLDGLVLTAIDNERIVIDLKQASWTSDFRDHASGEGPCQALGEQDQ